MKVPREWSEAAAMVTHGSRVHRAELDRFLNDSRILEILPQIDAALSTTFRTAPDIRKSLLFTIASRGGWQPPETVKEWAKRRKRIAKLARELSEVMATDAGCEHFTLEGLWALAVGIDPTRLIYDRHKIGSKIPTFSNRSLPKVGDSLGAFATAIERDLSGEDVLLNHWDRRPSLQPLAAQPGRVDAPRLLIERRLCEWFELTTGAAQCAFVATITEVALDLDSVDPEELAGRWRRFKKK